MVNPFICNRGASIDRIRGFSWLIDWYWVRYPFIYVILQMTKYFIKFIFRIRFIIPKGFFLLFWFKDLFYRGISLHWPFLGFVGFL